MPAQRGAGARASTAGAGEPDDAVRDEPADGPVLVLLRAVNVGGNGTVSMPALRAAATALGHSDVATYLGTGNLVLRPAAGALGSATAVDALATGLSEHLGLPLEVMVRTRGEVDAIVRDNPYPAVAHDDPAHLVVLFLDGPAPTEDPDLSRYGRESATWRGREAYLHYPNGIGRSKVTSIVLDRVSGRRGTGRNWRTVLALQQLLHDRM